MAIGTPTSRATATGTTSAINSGSITIPAGELVFVQFGQGNAASGTPAAGTIGDTAGWSWTVARDDIGATSGSTRTRQQIWTAVSNGSANTITCTPGTNGATCGLIVSSVSGAMNDTSNSQAGASNTGDPSATLPSAPGSTSAGFGFAYIGGGPTTLNPPSGFTELVEITPSGTRAHVCYDLSSPSQTCTWSTSGISSVGAYIEIKEPLAITADGLTVTSPAIGTPALTQKHVLAASALTVSALGLPSPTLTQKHVLSVTGLAVGSPVLDSPAFLSSYAFVGDALNVGSPVLGEPTPVPIYAFVADELAVGSPALDEPELVQAHVFEADGLTLESPELGEPPVDIVSGDTIIATPLTVTGPVLGTPALAQHATLEPSSLVVGSPVLGTPSLAQVVPVVATGFAVGSPDLGSPFLRLRYNFTANGIQVASPVLGHPFVGEGIDTIPAVTPPSRIAFAVNDTDGRTVAARSLSRVAASPGGSRIAEAN